MATELHSNHYVDPRERVRSSSAVMEPDLNSSSAGTDALERTFSVLAIVVLYRQKPSQSVSVTTLQRAIGQTTLSSLRCRILVADNTPGGQDPGPLDSEIQYRSYPNNPGLAQPFNDAIATGRQHGFDWILTLDQDTEVPLDFLDKMAWTATQYANNPAVAAVVPWITDSDKVVSPFRYIAGSWPVVLSRTASGLVPKHGSAVNSASLLRIQCLDSIGGYDLEFPLHNSDTLLFLRLDRAGYRIVIANDVVVPHQFSILRREERMTPQRYQQMLLDECVFWDRHMGFGGRLERVIRLIGRSVKSLLQRENASYRKITTGELKYRLLHTRNARLRDRFNQTFGQRC